MGDVEVSRGATAANTARKWLFAVAVLLMLSTSTCQNTSTTVSTSQELLDAIRSGRNSRIVVEEHLSLLSVSSDTQTSQDGLSVTSVITQQQIAIQVRFYVCFKAVCGRCLSILCLFLSCRFAVSMIQSYFDKYQG